MNILGSFFSLGLRRVSYFALVLLFSSMLGGAVKANAGVVTVTTTIQAAVNAANPGDTVRVPAGHYRENVTIAKNNITIKGSPGAVLDGTGLPGNSGITVGSPSPAARINGFTVTGLRIQNYIENGVFLIRVDNFRIDQGTYVNNEEYGIFPILSSHGVIEFNQVSGSNDTGIYLGQSHDAVIQGNRVNDCTVGVDVENSSEVIVRNNLLSGNSIGITAEVLPGLTVTATSGIQIVGNVLTSNNRPNPVTDPTDLLSLLPSGSGVLIGGADNVTVKNNLVTLHNSVGIVVAQLPPAAAALDPRIDPFPDNAKIQGNIVLLNGRNPDPRLAPLPPGDLIWDFSGSGNCWEANIFMTSFPAPLPGCR